MEEDIKKINFAQKPDAQGFDEVIIKTVPRYKTSGLSGDEWRISGNCKLLRKGKVIHEFNMSNVKNCAYSLPFHILRAGDDAKFYFAGGEDDKCDQEGCSRIATTLYKLKNIYCNEPYKHEGQKPDSDIHRGFCDYHKTRGNSDFEDQDSNYELVDERVEEMNGHRYLLEDIKSLLKDAENGEFGDFTNKKYAAPKLKLKEVLDEMSKSVVGGKYDNKPLN